MANLKTFCVLKNTVTVITRKAFIRVHTLNNNKATHTHLRSVGAVDLRRNIPLTQIGYHAKLVHSKSNGMSTKFVPKLFLV